MSEEDENEEDDNGEDDNCEDDNGEDDNGEDEIDEDAGQTNEAEGRVIKKWKKEKRILWKVQRWPQKN